jgi:hypothetical protein
MREPQSGSVGVVDPAVAGHRRGARQGRGPGALAARRGEGDQSLPARRPTVQRAVGLPGGDPVAVFAEVRHDKDVFR